MQYGSDIGRKFFEDGSVRTFQGNTCVADITERCAAYPVMLTLRKMLLSSPLADHYVPLPPESFHMTVFNGLNDQVRIDEKWPACLPKDTPMEKVDDHVEEALLRARLPGKLKMRFREVTFGKGAVLVRLEPADEKMEKIMRDFRVRAAEEMGVFFPGHATYKFHISLAYTRIIPEGEMEEEKIKLKEEMDALLQKSPVFETDPPYIAFFNDMLFFSPDRLPR